MHNDSFGVGAVPIIRPRRSKSPEEIAFERGELPVSEVVYTHADAESGGQVTASIRGFVVGSLLWDWRNGVPMLSTVSVVRQYQRKGIATGLVVHLAEHLQRHDFTYAHLTSNGAALQKDLSKRGRRNNGTQATYTQAYVRRVLHETDGTGDPEWLKFLYDKVKPYTTWACVTLDPDTLDNDCADYKTAREYAEGIEDAPPIVVVPDGTGQLTIIDGGHRALAASLVGAKIQALVPVP